ncbi:pectinesterase PPME1-like [Gossypium australe]|uniref:Pectinesterase n=1 Tax=Gossypium australe TaxID=47621 RepID=A0A5B6USS0_9ROSI|nr:pectinesterase PPME1-like [Gossypium australe]
MDAKRIEGNEVYTLAMCVSILLFAPIVVSQPLQADKAQPLKERGKTLDPELVEAETEPRIIKVMQGGGGEFDTITKAIESVPSGNAKRVIISIEPGSYKEKIKIERNKPFITLLGDPKNMPNLTFDGTAKQYGTVDSATLITESSYFVGANLNMWVFLWWHNTAPRPDGKMVGLQAVALRVSGDRSDFYNCKIIGFQDTLYDDRGNHFFKDCHIRGTVDFIFGSGTSLYLNSEIFVEGDPKGDPKMAVITAQARESSSEDTGTAKDVFLGRAWKSSPRVVYSYTKMDEIVHPGGWSSNRQPERAETVYYEEYKCTGKGATPATREKFVKQLSDVEAEPFLVLDYVEGTKWLLPPPTDMDAKRIEGNEVYALAMCVSILLFAPIVVSQPIPTDKSQVEAWFNGIIKPVKERGKTLDPELVEAETEPRIIKVMQGGGGEFDTITKAIESVPSGNAKCVIISIGPGSYKEKIKIERNKPFITLLGDPKNMPNLTFDGIAKQSGTVDSATLITESSYFVGANLNIVSLDIHDPSFIELIIKGFFLWWHNTAPRPDGKMVGAQAVALRVSSDRLTFYNCKIIGFQDTLCDDRGNHFFKDCHIRGTVDFIFGSGTSLYLGYSLNCEGVLCFQGKVCMPKDVELRQKILQEAHSSPYAMHPRGSKMYRDLREHF